MKQKLFLLLMLFGSIPPLLAQKNAQPWENSRYFDTQYLRDSELVHQALLHTEKMADVTFKSEDGLKLTGMYKEAKDAIGTIVFAGGFLPGRLETLSPLIKLVDSNYNLLFFNARGHGPSEGFFKFIQLGNYGLDDYKDIIGAIKFAKSKSDAPIVLHGTCSGAFHMAHALIKIKDQVEELNIKGLIFDSGWVKVSTVGVCTALEELKKIRNPIKRNFVHGILKVIEFLVFDKILKNDSITSLNHKMHDINIPVLFIHSTDDYYAPFIDVHSLYEETPNAEYWWIPTSSHSNHWLKYKAEYAKRFRNFCTKVLQSNGN